MFRKFTIRVVVAACFAAQVFAQAPKVDFGRDKDAFKKAQREILGLQRGNGGWASAPSMESDAYRTGLALTLGSQPPAGKTVTGAGAQ